MINTAIETCTVCGHVNRPGELACANCGTLLVAGPLTKQISFTEDALRIAVGPTGKVFMAEQRRITLKIGDEQVVMQLGDSLIVGRQIPGDVESLPVEDLTPYGAAEKGVSRQHIKLTLKNDMVYATDLGSTNGTRLNGHTVLPNSARLLRDGDTLQLGSLAMTVRFDAIA